MNKLNITVIAAAVALVFSTGAMASSMSKDEYKAGKADIAKEYKSARIGCDSFSANAKDVCMAEAKGKEKVANAQFDAEFKPTTKSGYNVSIVKADASYAIAKEKCDDKAGNDKDVCLKEAKAAQTAAKADAKALLTTTASNQVASDKTAKARATASQEKAVANKDAATEKRNADYAVAKEKCDTFAGEAKTSCVNQAKSRYGQS